MAAVDGFSIPQSILRHFDLTSTPYSEGFVKNATARRKVYPSQKLLLDCFLEIAELQGSSLYPPTTPAGFRRLLHSIHSSTLDRLKQDCLFYYLLLDYDGAESKKASPPNGAINGNHGMEVDGLDNGEGGEAEGSSSASQRVNGVKESRSEEFANKRFLPDMWRVFMKGYWSLDRGLWEDAINLLCDPSILEVSLVPSILQLLSTRVSPPSLALDLLHRFFTSTHHIPSTPLETDLHCLAHAAGSTSLAFGYIRSQDSPDVRTRLRDVLWSWAFGAPRGPCGRGPHSVQKHAVGEILQLPLLPEEESHLRYFLAHPPKALTPAALSLLHDMVTLRLIHRGAYAESMQLDRDLAGSAGTEGDRQRRREMVREFISILPEVQRRSLQIESEAIASRPPTNTQPVNGYAPEEDMVQDDGWPELPPDETQADIEPNLLGMEIPLPVSESSIFTAAAAQPAAGSPAPPRVPSPVNPAHAGSPFIGSPSLPPTQGSPFAGPPKFTLNAPGAASPMQRVLSGSPFRPPPPPAVSGKPTKRLVDDERAPRRMPVRKTAKGLGRTPSEVPMEVSEAAPAEAEEGIMSPPPAPAPAPAPAPVPAPAAAAAAGAEMRRAASQDSGAPVTRRSTRVTSGNNLLSPPSAPSAASRPPPAPSSRSAPSRPARSTRQTTAPPTLAEFPEMPGAFGGPSFPSRPARASSAVPEARSRSVRSASRALLDEGDVDPRPTPKKRKNAREGSAAPSVASTTRRSTRRGASVAQGSEMGSPTPSVKSTRGKAPARASSATPRATRSRKA